MMALICVQTREYEIKAVIQNTCVLDASPGVAAAMPHCSVSECRGNERKGYHE
jgi:hypothetical protein